ncbi:MAG: hypothetical protein HY961_06190 [Ignavibacteriae bacterium]|nr:hypothetical protein [Ignavibacteriota bacterium]
MKHAPPVKGTLGRHDRVFESNREYYYAHKTELLRRYRNKYIAIWNEDVVDADKDRLALLRRVRASIGYEPVFVKQVTVHPRIVRIPSYALRARPKSKA